MSDGVEVSTDRVRIDRDAVHRYLRDESYWARGISRRAVDRSIDNSLCFSVLVHGEQAAFARAVTDGATFAWLADVFVLPAFQGRGLGKRLVEAALAHPELSQARRVLLATDDAHGLYRRYGFEPLDDPERYMLFRPPGRERLEQER